MNKVFKIMLVDKSERKYPANPINTAHGKTIRTFLSKGIGDTPIVSLEKQRQTPVSNKYAHPSKITIR